MEGYLQFAFINNFIQTWFIQQRLLKNKFFCCISNFIQRAVNIGGLVLRWWLTKHVDNYAIWQQFIFWHEYNFCFVPYNFRILKEMIFCENIHWSRISVTEYYLFYEQNQKSVVLHAENQCKIFKIVNFMHTLYQCHNVKITSFMICIVATDFLGTSIQKKNIIFLWIHVYAQIFLLSWLY